MPEWQNDILHIDLEQTSSWAAIRMALPDRLPAVGEFDHPEFKGLNVCTGMGARGISWSVLCGELLVAQLNQEPLPMAVSLAKLMAASRFG
jgi:tRNA 5-methylaminomethyl-2-thiouridine biosynthesis bifunctional protein